MESTSSDKSSDLISEINRDSNSKLNDARFKFALDSLKKYILKNPKNNVFFSPHLIYQNLFIICLGTEIDNIENSLRRVLHIPDEISKSDLWTYYRNEGYKQFCYMRTERESSCTCRISSRIWVSEYVLLNPFIQYTLLQSSHWITKINFDTYPNKRRLFINTFIKGVTENRIQDFLPPQSIDSNTDLVLANVICYKTEIQDPLESGTDSDYSFDSLGAKDSNDDAKNDRNSENQNLDQNDKSNAKPFVIFKELSSSKRNISMFFVSIKDDSQIEESDKIIKYLEYLITKEGFQEFRYELENMKTREANDSFSTFKFVQDLRMYELLEILGVPEHMSFGYREETVSLEKNSIIHDLKLGDTLHRVDIETTSDRIIATASNAFFTANLSQHEYIDTGATHNYEPSICLIYDKINRNILFCGALLEEKKEIAV